jgi:CRP-like cAMP-binding protein
MDNTNPATAILLKRLKATTELDDEDIRTIESLPLSSKRVGSDQPIVSTGDRPSSCCLLIDGFIIRAKNTSDGRRQILSIHQPGDIPDLQSLFLHVMDHDVITLGECVVGFIPHQPVRELLRTRPNVAEVLWRDTLIDAAVFREWILNIGQRSGPARLAHLFIELFTRLKVIQRTRENTFGLPLTQAQLGEAIGMSAVHVNRIVQQFRRDGLLEFSHGVVHILDEEALKELAGFESLYLHLHPSL